MVAHQINWKAAAVVRHVPHTEKVVCRPQEPSAHYSNLKSALETTPACKGFAADWGRPYEDCATQNSSDPCICFHFILSVTTYSTPPECGKLSHFFPFAERDGCNDPWAFCSVTSEIVCLGSVLTGLNYIKAISCMTPCVGLQPRTTWLAGPNFRIRSGPDS